MNEEDMTMDALPYLIDNKEIDLRYEQLLNENNIEKLNPKDQILYRILVIIGKKDSEIIPLLSPNVFMKRSKKL